MEYKIYTGSMLAIKEGFLKGKFRLMYCGMPNASTFAITPYIADGYQGFSPTIIYLLYRYFEVLDVNAEYLIIGD